MLILPGYNRRVRTVLTFLLILGLAGCNHGVEDNAAVRQGVLDYLSQKAGMNVAAMDITLTAVKIDGSKADATVSFAAKVSKAAAALMTMQYHLELKDSKWAVVGRQDSGQHGATQAPATPGGSPHGDAMPMTAPGASGKMPAPEDLPPAGKKK
jgi:hypothetical protein